MVPRQAVLSAASRALLNDARSFPQKETHRPEAVVSIVSAV